MEKTTMYSVFLNWRNTIYCGLFGGAYGIRTFTLCRGLVVFGAFCYCFVGKML